MAAATGGDLRVGDRVLVWDPGEASSVPGTVVKQVGGDRWAVKADGSMKSRIVLSDCLQKVALDPGAAPTCVIVGSWDDFDDRNTMRWDARNACFEYWIVLRGEQSFKFLLGGDWNRCVHPSAMDMLPYNDSAVEGPDNGGLGEYLWTLGGPADSTAVDGAKYNICLYMRQDGVPQRVGCCVEVPPARAGAAEKAPPLPAAPRSLARALTHALQEPDPAAQGRHPVEGGDREDRVTEQAAASARVRWQARQRAKDEERKVVEEERAARERLAKRLEAAAEADMLRIKDQEEEGGRGPLRDAPSETRRATVVEQLGEICFECRQASDRWCCPYCWAAYKKIVARGWDAEVCIGGVAAGDHARRAAERWKLLPQRARESILCQFQCHFPRRRAPATPEMLQKEHKLFPILPSKAVAAAHKKSSEAGRRAPGAGRRAGESQQRWEEELAGHGASEATSGAVQLAEQIKQKAAAVMRG